MVKFDLNDMLFKITGSKDDADEGTCYAHFYNPVTGQDLFIIEYEEEGEEEEADDIKENLSLPFIAVKVLMTNLIKLSIREYLRGSVKDLDKQLSIVREPVSKTIDREVLERASREAIDSVICSLNF